MCSNVITAIDKILCSYYVSTYKPVLVGSLGLKSEFSYQSDLETPEPKELYELFNFPVSLLSSLVWLNTCVNSGLTSVRRTAFTHNLTKLDPTPSLSITMAVNYITT